MALRAVLEHPKFAALKCALDLTKFQALGALECLWHFAGKYCPQGNVGRFSDVQIEAWLEWKGPRGAMVTALVESGWLDASPEHRLLVHDWHEHADGTTKKTLGRKGLEFLTIALPLSGQLPDMSSLNGKRRSPPEPVPEPVPEPEKEQESKPAPSGAAPQPAEEFFKAWNAVAGQTGLPAVVKFTNSRRKQVQSRIRNGTTLHDFRHGCEMAARSAFCMGENTRGWVATFDWLLREGNLAKTLEGNYLSPAQLIARHDTARAAQRPPPEKPPAATLEFSDANGTAGLVWGGFLREMEAKTNRQTFDTWLRPTRALALKGSVLLVRVPSVQFEQLAERFAPDLQRFIEEAHVSEVKFMVGGASCITA